MVIDWWATLFVYPASSCREHTFSDSHRQSCALKDTFATMSSLHHTSYDVPLLSQHLAALLQSVEARFVGRIVRNSFSCFFHGFRPRRKNV